MALRLASTFPAALLLAALVLSVLLAAAQPARAQSDAGACIRHVGAAERAHGIPPGLLMAIGVVEARWNGTIWPWTLNINGVPHYLPDRAAALARMSRADGSMHADMAVGCMQVFVKYHRQEFRGPADMLDPARNVWYAASYLTSLRREEGNWIKAVGRYHAGNPADQKAYLCRVVRARVGLGYQTPTAQYKAMCG
mgnify:CR=1 FL=1